MIGLRHAVPAVDVDASRVEDGLWYYRTRVEEVGVSAGDTLVCEDDLWLDD